MYRTAQIRLVDVLVSGAIATLASAVVPVALGAQSTAATTVPPAASADVRSVDAIVAALYDVISGPAGERNWARFRSLFVPGARLIATRHPASGPPVLQVMTPDEFVANATPALAKQPFYEREIGRRSERYGTIAHVFSAYESKRAPTDNTGFARGINSIQLWNDGARWYVVTIYWDDERSGEKVPQRYLQPNRSGNSAP